MRPYSVNDVADSIILKLNAEEDHYLVNLKLQKLVYYIQAWNYGKNRDAFMRGAFEAWIHGPVHRDLYARFKEEKTLYSLIGREDVKNEKALMLLSPEDSEFIDLILDNYASFSATDLEKMTHGDKPWREARGGLDPLERCTREISAESMKAFYGERWEKVNGRP